MLVLILSGISLVLISKLDDIDQLDKDSDTKALKMFQLWLIPIPMLQEKKLLLHSENKLFERILLLKI